MRWRNTVKKFVCFTLVAVLMFGFIGRIDTAVLPTEAKSVSQMQDEINQLEGEKSKLNTKIDSLQNDIDQQQAYLDTLNSYISTVESKIITCESMLAAYQGEIDKFNKQISKKEKELAKNKELFKRRVCSLYMSGSNSPLLILVGSDYFADYLSMNQFTDSLSEYDNQLMAKINVAVKEINRKIKKKNKAIDAQNDIKQQLADERAELQQKQNEASGVLSKINGKQKDLKSELASVESAINSLEGSIQAAYEAARQAALDNNATVTAKYDGKGFAWPLPGYSMITSPFGMRYDPYYCCYRGHKGIDISGAGVAGKPIIASAKGTVTVAEFNTGGYGNYVVISHGFHNEVLYTTHYGHMVQYCVSVGQHVNQGDVIGYVGTTGASVGEHLHFEIRLDNNPVDPLGYVSYS